MNGPDHYQAAEKYLTHAEAGPSALIAERMQLAQVHATLALTAATTPNVVSGPALTEIDPLLLAVLRDAHCRWGAAGVTRASSLLASAAPAQATS